MEVCPFGDIGTIYYNNISENKSTIHDYSLDKTGAIKYTDKKKRMKLPNKHSKNQDQSLACPLVNESECTFCNNCKTLKSICISYIVTNFSLVDSLIGLPEVVGKEIFDACNEGGVFKINETGSWLKAMDIFVTAFGRVIFNSLVLSEKGMFLAFCFDYIKPFLLLEEIDFSSCRIGDNQEILMHVGKLHCLQKLNLSNNSLGVNGISYLTCSHRRSKKGLDNLKVLRLDKNENLTKDIFLYLEPLPKLRVVVLDHNHDIVKHFHSHKKQNRLNVCPHNILFHDDIFLSHQAPKMHQGWAGAILERCYKEFNLRMTVSQKQTTKPMASSFYGKCKSVELIQQVQRRPTSSHSQTNHLVVCDCLHSSSLNKHICLEKESCKPHHHKKESFSSKRTLMKNVTSRFCVDESILDLYRS